jgi:hypothetical protein
MKLAHQLKSGGTGGKRIFDTVESVSENWDEKTKVLKPAGVGARAQCSVVDMLNGKNTGLDT